MSTLLACGALASVVSVPAAALMADWGDWRLPFFVAGLLAVVSLAANILVFPRDSRERVRNIVIFSRYWSVIVIGYFQVALTVNVSHRLVYWTIVTFFAAFMIHTYEISEQFVALPLAIAAIGQVIGNYSGGMVATNRYRSLLIASSCAVGGACGFLFFAMDLPFWVAVAVATVGTGVLSVNFPALVAGGTEYSGASTATGVGLMGFSNNFGGAMGAAVAGSILSESGYYGIAYLCLGAAAVSVLLAGLFGKQLRRPGQ